MERFYYFMLGYVFSLIVITILREINKSKMNKEN